MANLQFFIENFGQLIEESKIQLESLTNDVRELPMYLQKVVSTAQQSFEATGDQIQMITQDLLKGDLLQQNLKPELHKVVVSLEEKVDNAFEIIKTAIERAK